MKRRSLLKTLAAAPAVAQTAAAQSAAAPAQQLPALTLGGADQVADPVRRFLSQDQFAALSRLGDMLVPAYGGRPSAGETEAAIFLDFLVRESPPVVRNLYQTGLDHLNDAARTQFGAPYAAIAAEQAAKLVEPLKQAWTYEGPSDPLARFLHQAKADILQAALNSRQWAESSSRGRRGAGGMTNYYWRAIE
jgi:hypothetical protein